jgi:hypothetical protein
VRPLLLLVMIQAAVLLCPVAAEGCCMAAEAGQVAATAPALHKK